MRVAAGSRARVVEDRVEEAARRSGRVGIQRLAAKKISWFTLQSVRLGS
jgi:hypothetical protein